MRTKAAPNLPAGSDLRPTSVDQRRGGEGPNPATSGTPLRSPLVDLVAGTRGVATKPALSAGVRTQVARKRTYATADPH